MTYCRKPGLGGRRQRKLLNVLQIVLETPHASSRLDPGGSIRTMLQVFCLLLVNFASAERGRDGERLTKSHGTRTRSRDSTGAWGAWSSTSKRDSRGITEEEVILQELKELILEEDIGEVRRHESGIGRRGNRRGDGQRERGGRQVGDAGQFREGRIGTGVKFERQVET